MLTPPSLSAGWKRLQTAADGHAKRRREREAEGTAGREEGGGGGAGGKPGAEAALWRIVRGADQEGPPE